MWIVGYFIAPFIIYSINDYLAGYYRDRLGENMGIYGESDGFVIAAHLLWPLAIILLGGAWVFNICRRLVDASSLDTIYDAGKERRRKETDLDYQAEKYLTGDKK
jgi:hypothetical protein